jgi:hypothetical protein
MERGPGQTWPAARTSPQSCTCTSLLQSQQNLIWNNVYFFMPPAALPFQLALSNWPGSGTGIWILRNVKTMDRS